MVRKRLYLLFVGEDFSIEMTTYKNQLSINYKQMVVKETLKTKVPC